MAHFERKTDNRTSIMLSDTTYHAWSRPVWALGPITLAASFSVEVTNFSIGEK